MAMTTAMPKEQHRRSLPEDAAVTECNDGTICENWSPCIPHPAKEGSYMCDCFEAHAGDDQDQVVNYAGVYCEHRATSYCQSGSAVSAHAFCTNGGECKRAVGRTEEHAGCKCPGGYEGDFCQFVEGSKPSDWTLDNFMHPSLVSVHGRNQAYSESSSIAKGFLIGASVAFVLLALLAWGYFYDYHALKEKLKRSEKESDTGSADETTSLGGRRSSGSSSAFFGGKSVYKKKTSTGDFVTPDTLEADGGTLTEALGENQELVEKNFADVDVEQKTSLDEVDLNDGGSGELM